MYHAHAHLFWIITLWRAIASCSSRPHAVWDLSTVDVMLSRCAALHLSPFEGSLSHMESDTPCVGTMTSIGFFVLGVEGISCGKPCHTVLPTWAHGTLDSQLRRQNTELWWVGLLVGQSVCWFVDRRESNSWLDSTRLKRCSCNRPPSFGNCWWQITEQWQAPARLVVKVDSGDLSLKPSLNLEQRFNCWLIKINPAELFQK